MPVPNEDIRAHLKQLIADQIASFVGRVMPNYVGDLRPYFQPLANQIEAAIHVALPLANGSAPEAHAADEQ